MSIEGWVLALTGMIAWLWYLHAMRAAVEAEVERLFAEGEAAPSLDDRWVVRWALRASLMSLAVLDLGLIVACVADPMQPAGGQSALGDTLVLGFIHVLVMVGCGMVAWRSIRSWESAIMYGWKQDHDRESRPRED